MVLFCRYGAQSRFAPRCLKIARPVAAYMVALIAVILAGHLLCAAEKDVLLTGEDASEWEGMVKINSRVKRSGDGSFELYGRYPTELISSRMIPVEMDRTYTVSAWFRTLEADLPASAYMGLRMYDKDGREININNVDVFPGTKTVLASDAFEGTKELLVGRNPEWLKRLNSVIAFNADDEYRDLPNFHLSPHVEEVIEEGPRYRVVLRGRLRKDYPAGTKIRLHAPYGAPLFWLASGWMPAEWKNFRSAIRGEAPYGAPKNKFWKGTEYARVFVWFGNYDRIPREGARLLVDDISFVSSSLPMYAFPRRIYNAYPLGREPAIDGRIHTDRAWEAVPPTGEFFPLYSSDYPKEQTSFRAGYTPEALYIGVKCIEPDMDGINASPGDGGALWTEDSIELFFSPGGEPAYLQFIINAIGSKWSASYQGPGAGAEILEAGSWEAAAFKGRGCWCIEVKIPFEVLGRLPEKNEAWKFNVARNRYRSAHRMTTWSPLLLTGFHELENFGRIVFIR